MIFGQEGVRYSDDDNENARWMKNAPSLTPTLSLIASSVGKFFEPPSLPPSPAG